MEGVDICWFHVVTVRTRVGTLKKVNKTMILKRQREQKSNKTRGKRNNNIKYKYVFTSSLKFVLPDLPPSDRAVCRQDHQDRLSRVVRNVHNFRFHLQLAAECIILEESIYLSKGREQILSIVYFCLSFHYTLLQPLVAPKSRSSQAPNRCFPRKQVYCSLLARMQSHICRLVLQLWLFHMIQHLF